ncbi:MAG: pilus assembly protein TadG-related protein [Pseudomonadota bacterium]
MNFEYIEKFSRSKSGNISMMFALLLVPIILSAGMYFDYSRVSDARSQTQNAVDAATLAAARETEKSDEELGDFSREFLFANRTDSGVYALEDIDVSRSADGTVTISLAATIPSVFMKIGNFRNLDYSVTASAVLRDAPVGGTGCVYMTDPRNTGLRLEDNSQFSSNCVVMITTKGVAINISDRAVADLSDFCTNGRIVASGGSLTPNAPIADCDVVVDPFSSMSRPKELSGACVTNSDLTVTQSQAFNLAAGVHCAEIRIEMGGKISLDPGVHFFPDGLVVEQGGTLEGDDVLLAFDRQTRNYYLSGTLDVSGLTSGPYQGFVIYHEDYIGPSNSIHVEDGASFRADGVIYLPNTNMKLEADINGSATQSILVVDRFELANDAGFHAVIDSSSATPLPLADLSITKKVPVLVQ